MGQDALLDRHHVDDGKLQPLGRVQRHDRHAVLFVIPGVHVAGKRDVLEEIGDGAAIILFDELAGGGDKLLDVGQALLVIRIAALLEHAPVAGAIEHVLDEPVGRGVERVAQIVHQGDEALQSRGRLAADGGDLVDVGRRCQEAHLSRVGVCLQVRQ